MTAQHVLQAMTLQSTKIRSDGQPYGVAEFGGGINDNALCLQTKRIVDELTPETVLEIGSGGGRWSGYLHTRCKNLICVDYTDATVDHITALNLTPPPAYMICRDGKYPTFIGADLVFSYDTFVHFPPDLFWGYLKTIPKTRLILHHGLGSQVREDWFGYDPREVDNFLGMQLVEEIYCDKGNELQSRIAHYYKKN